ncbi:hypothetical protein, partial [Komagataeibacter intermedius]|uniref:hypothetical protein n=1 Tax=Komagataeibacter intermedius TaxID=66229 RepID=UPI00222F012D
NNNINILYIVDSVCFSSKSKLFAESLKPHSGQMVCHVTVRISDRSLSAKKEWKNGKSGQQP